MFRRSIDVTLRLLVLLLFLPLAVGEWGQQNGDPGRTGLTSLQGGPLDAVARLDMLPEGHRTHGIAHIGWIDSPHGLLTASRDQQDACHFVTFDLPSRTFSSIPIADCAGATPQGYDPVRDLFLVCGQGPATEGALIALDAASGEERWRTTYDQMAILDPAMWWACLGGVLERDRVVIPLASSRTGGDFVRHRIAAVDLDGGSPL